MRKLTEEEMAYVELSADQPLGARVTTAIESAPKEDTVIARLVLDARIRRLWQVTGHPTHGPRLGTVR